MVWINVQAAAFDVEVRERPELAMIAVQGPNAREKMASLLSAQGAAAAAKLGKFVGADIDDLFIARTGYTGEGGYEVIVPESADRTAVAWGKGVSVRVNLVGLRII